MAVASQDQRTVNNIGGSRDSSTEVAGVKESVATSAQHIKNGADATGKTLRQIIISTPPLMKNNAKGVVIKSLKRKKTKSGGIAYIAVAVDVVKHKIPPKHQCYIIGKDSSNQTVSKNKQKVMIHCNCENFLYYWEYANWKNGCSKIINGNGEPPTMTNPGLRVGACKHLVALAEVLVERGL